MFIFDAKRERNETKGGEQIRIFRSLIKFYFIIRVQRIVVGYFLSASFDRATLDR